MNCKRPCRGFTLLELLVSISVGAVLMVVTVGWIHQSLKFSSLMKQRQRQHANLTRLAWQLRDDVRDSQSLSMAGENQLVLTANRMEITYTLAGNSMFVEKQRSHPDNQPAITREAYEFSPNSIARWDTSELPSWISLVVSGRPQAKPLPESADSFESAGNKKSGPIGGERLPVDLHVRVAPNRWPMEASTEGSAATDQKVKK